MFVYIGSTYDIFIMDLAYALCYVNTNQFIPEHKLKITFENAKSIDKS